MPTPLKAQVIEETRQKFEKCSGVYFTNYQGINVTQITKLRDKFREKNVEYKVSKNTLIRIGAQQAGYEGVSNFLNGMVGIAYSDNDPTAPAQVIKEFLSSGGNIEVTGILFEGQLFGPEKYKELAELPSREVLLSRLLGGLSFPMSQLAATLSGAMSKFARTLDSLKNTKD
ncbi:MAG: 50S ribosomal protein L10 [Candidatus Marinimicrobia bacterium]|nr:50S ribosomal protein L10 [Candidatus Neomarinimicrobiota bacterium]